MYDVIRNGAEQCVSMSEQVKHERRRRAQRASIRRLQSGARDNTSTRKIRSN